MSEGIPVIATNLGPRSELIKDGVTGFLYELNNATDFTDKVLRLINYRALRTQMGKATHEEYQKKYSKYELQIIK